MTQAKLRFPTFEAYLEYEGDAESRYELIDGALIELPPESESNVSIANYLFLILVNAGVSLRLVHTGRCEVQVPVLQADDPQNRYPDLVVLDEVHLALTQKRLTIRLEMPPPRLIAEVVSPGQTNRDRDYNRKRSQYCQRRVPEYWIIDPEAQAIVVLQLEDEQLSLCQRQRYVEIGTFRGADCLRSLVFPNLNLTAAQVFQAAEST